MKPTDKWLAVTGAGCANLLRRQNVFLGCGQVCCLCFLTRKAGLCSAAVCFCLMYFSLKSDHSLLQVVTKASQGGGQAPGGGNEGSRRARGATGGCTASKGRKGLQGDAQQGRGAKGERGTGGKGGCQSLSSTTYT